MYKKIYLKSLLLLAMLLSGAGSTWAQDVTYDFTGSDWTVSNGTLTNGTVSFVGEGGDNFKMNSGYFFFGKRGAYIDFPTYDSPVEKIVVTGRSGASTSTLMNVFVGDQAVSEETTGCTGTNTYEIDSDYQEAGTTYTLKVTSSHNAQITKIEVYFASSSGQKEECDLTLTNTTNALSFDLYNNNAAQTLTYSTSSTGAVTVTSEYVNAIVNETNKTITVTPVKATSGVQTVTVKQAADDTYDAGSATFTVNITNSAPSTVYEKVTSANQLVAGNEYILVATDASMAMGGVNSGNAKIRDNVAVTVANDQVSITNEAVAVLTLGGSAGAWTFLASDNDKYLALTGNSNEVHASDDATLATSKWIITNDFQLETTAQTDTRYLRYNSGSPRFACYKNGQKEAYLFVKAGGEVSDKADADLSFGETTAFEVNLGEEFTAPTLSNPNQLEVVYTSSNTDVATVDETTGAVTIVAAGQTTITASFAGNDEYNEGSASYTLTVVDPNAPGTENNPYTVAQAIEYINTLGTSTSPNEVYVSGIISQVDSYNSNYKSITYWISDDGTTSNQMEVYGGKGVNDADFASVDDLQVGDIVTVKGFVKTYSGTPEFDKNNQLVSHSRPTNTDPTITLDPSTINVDAEEHNGTIAISLENLTVEDKAEFGVQYWNGNEPVEEIDWITVEIAEQDPQVGEGFVVSYTVAANDGPTRTAAFKVYVEGDEETVWSDLVTITQAAYVAPPTPVEGSYVKVTSTDDITDGQYLIVYEGNETHDAVAFNGGLETLDAANNIIAVTIENDEIAASEATQAAEFTINVADGTIKSASGLYIGKNANSNGLDASAETQYTNTFDIASDEAVITASSGCTLRYNYASDQLRFRYYKSGQQAIQLYKFVSNEPEVEYYLAGSFAEDGWDEGMLKMTNKNGIYSVTKEIEAETEFKIVKKDIDGTTTWYGGEGEDTYLIHRDWCTDIVLVDGENFIINEAGEYTFSVNTTGTALTLSVDGFPAQQFFLAGTFNEWSATATQFEVGETEGVYTLTQELEAGAEFKVVSEGKWYGTTEPISAENCSALPLSDDSQIANMTVPAAGVYTFTLEKTPNGLFLSIAGFPEPVVKYYLAGSWNEWSEMVELAEQEDGSFVATQEFPANTEFKIVKDVDGEQTWYGGDTQGEGEVYGIHSEWCNDIALTAGDAGKNFIIEAEGNYTFTMNITDNGMFLSVAGWPVPVVEYALVSDASKLEAGKKILFVGENSGTYYAMGAQNNNNRAAAEVDVVDGKIIPGEGVAASTLVANEDGTWSFLTSDGYLYAASNTSNQLKSKAEIDDYAKATISIGEDNLATILFEGDRERHDLRFNASNNPPLFSCYAESNENMNHVYIYMETSEEVIPETVTAEVSAAGLATFCSEWALDFTGIEEVYAYKVSVNEKQISYTRVYQVPAETGVVLRSLSGDAISVEVPVIESADEIADNALVAVLEAIESLPTDGDGYTNYILNNLPSKGVGFYKANNQPVGAGKAYLQVEGTLSKDFIGFADGVATGIETIDNGWTVDNEIYDLQGRKVMNPTKGIFIQNGRKVVIK